jgi:hypothetical protein
MSLKETFQRRLEGHIADLLLTTSLGAIAAIAWFAGSLLPDELIRSLGLLLSAQILIALSLVVILLSAWILCLRLTTAVARPKGKERKFNNALGFYEDRLDGYSYCAKCDNSPLQVLEQGRGWYCVKCDHTYDNPEWIKKLVESQRREREAEDAGVRAYNSGPQSWMS